MKKINCDNCQGRGGFSGLSGFCVCMKCGGKGYLTHDDIDFNIKKEYLQDIETAVAYAVNKGATIEQIEAFLNYLKSMYCVVPQNKEEKE